MAKANDRQEGGSHYKDKAIQPWDFISSNDMGFLAGNVVKYVARYKEKNGMEDLKKAKHYLEKLMEVENTTAPTYTVKVDTGGYTVTPNAAESRPAEAVHSLTQEVWETDGQFKERVTAWANSAVSKQGPLYSYGWDAK